MIRRKFLQGLGLLGLGAGLPFSAREAGAAAKPPGLKRNVAPVALKGKVQHNGKGIAGVAVTDGYNVVQTDQGGSYSFSSHPAAEFVYVSLPRGYAIPHEKGVARFYAPIKAGSKTQTANFALEKLSVDDTKHAFVVWADPQIIDRQDAEKLLTQSAPDLQQLVAQYGPDTPFHAIGCGDLVWDKFELFPDYKKAVEISGIPFFQVIGNHDLDLNARADDGSAQTFKSLFGPTYYSFNRGDIHYVVLDDVFFLGKGKNYIGYLTEEQLQWLEQDLSLVKPGSTVVISVHIPVNNGDQRRNKAPAESIGGVVANRAELYRILQPYKAHIMSGHTHYNEKVITGNTMEHVHGTVCGAWWTGPICKDGTPSGYGVYEVNGSDLRWYYKSVGKDKSHQFRLYPRGSVPGRPEEIAVNAWNWDPEWKVTWFEDGVRKGEMTQEISLDPLSVQLHAGASLPAKHPWVEPGLTDHLFYARPSAHAREIRVEVTDRFGQVFAEKASV
ncbi:calcineurin-like phosphoesterase family protein [soil metagenome]